MMKKGFTMIELIFIIVIIGILAVVALPKLTDTAQDAKKALINDWVGTLNRTTAPALWLHVQSTNYGSIKNLTNAYLKDNIDIPKEVTLLKEGKGGGKEALSGCIDLNASSVPKGASLRAKAIALVKIDNSATSYLYCINGNSTTSPKFGFDVGLRTLSDGTKVPDINRTTLSQE